MKIPDEANKALLIIQKQLESSLIAVYLHGSSVSSGLRPHSDVDLIVIIEKPMTLEVRKSLTADLMTISGRYPFDIEGRRPLEVIVFLRSDLIDLPYPAKSTFMYGEWLRHEIEMGEIIEPVCDPELTLVLAQASHEAISLIGSSSRDLFPVIPKSDIHRAMKDALPALIKKKGDERNVVLTLARMWTTCVTGAFVSKDAAASWAITQLPPEQAAILIHARDIYLGINKEDWHSCEKGLELTVDSLHKHIQDNL